MTNGNEDKRKFIRELNSLQSRIEGLSITYGDLDINSKLHDAVSILGVLKTELWYSIKEK
jgi:hypothetical protein